MISLRALSTSLRSLSRRPLLRLLAGCWLLFSLFSGTSAAAASPSLPLTGQHVLVLGDSITQDGRYVSYLEYYLHTVAPAAETDLISIGLSSETVSGLSEKNHPFPRPCVLERLDRALKAVKPTVVLACYGMNDGIYHPSSPERLAAFTTGIRELVTQVRATGAALVLITPPIFDPLPIRARAVAADATEFGYATPFVNYDQVLAEFARAELTFAGPGVTVIDLHTILAAELIAHRALASTFSFAPDGIHPGDAGHLLIARTLLTSLGYPPPPASDDAEVARLATDPLYTMVNDRRRLRSEAWRPFVGYERGGHFKSDSVDANEKVAARLATEIDVLSRH